jgi:N-acetylglucosaminyldiphosphoundecaprenol N-acetyl-beta-D-mannosaminyltransferase
MPTPSPTEPTGRAPIAILGVPFDNVTLDDLPSIIAAMIAAGRPHYAATVDVDFLVEAMEDVELRRILFDAHLVLAGEKPVIWASKMLGNPLPQFIPARQLVSALLALAAQNNWRVFFLGGTEPGLLAAAEMVRGQYPKLPVAGSYSPPEQPVLEMDHAEILHRIHAAKPDILLVAFGCPKAEKWISMNFREARVPFTLGIGAALDFLAGTLPAKRATPQSNTKKIWNFSRAVLRQSWQLRTRKTAPSAGAANVIPDPFGNLVIRVPIRLGAAEVQLCRAEWLRAVKSGHVMFDLSDTVFADSTGIGLLIRLRKQARDLGNQFILVAPRPPVAAALRLMKLDEFFTIQASLAGARILMESAAGAPTVTSGVTEKELQIRWVGEITVLNVVELGAFTESELAQVTPGMNVVIDLSRVTFVDSTGIGLMLRFKKNLKRRDVELKFINVSGSVLNVFRHTRLEEYLLGAEQ